AGALAAQRDKIEGMAATAPASLGQALRRRGARHLLDQAVPGAADLAAPDPFRRDRTALLAGVAGLGFSHSARRLRLLSRRKPGPTHPRMGGSRLSPGRQDRKSTRLNSSHVKISYAVFCLKKKKKHK